MGKETKDRVGILFGGRSSEYEISLMSAESVIGAIDREKHDVVMIGVTRKGEFKLFQGDVTAIGQDRWEEESEHLRIEELPEVMDFAFPVLHGQFGEDGKFQGMLEYLNIPYAGSGVLASTLAMDKVSTKRIFKAYGVPSCRYVYVDRVRLTKNRKMEEEILDRCEQSLEYPMFVKPSNAGSSVGISKVRTREELKDGLYEAAKIDSRILVEQGVDGREIEVGVLGNGEPEVTHTGEIITAKDFYDYEAKYGDDSGTQIIVPAELDAATEERLRKTAWYAYRCLACRGYARVDFLVEKHTGNLYCNEINTLPGFTHYSMFPSLWAEEGMDFTRLIDRIIELGYQRFQEESLNL